MINVGKHLSNVQMTGSASHVSIETNAATTEGNNPFNVKWIILLSNDGSDDIKINFDASTTSSGAFTIKPGEAFADIPRTCTTIYYKANSGAQAFRAWGV